MAQDVSDADTVVSGLSWERADRYTFGVKRKNIFTDITAAGGSYGSSVFLSGLLCLIS